MEQIYLFRDFDKDNFVSLYLDAIAEHQEIESINMFTGECTYNTIKAHSGVKNRDRIIEKCMYLQDVIIRKAYARRDTRTFSLNARILQNIIGKEFKAMLDVLISMGYIERGDGSNGADKHYYYRVGEYSTLFTMKDVEYTIQNLVNKRIIDYKNKTANAISGFIKQHVDDIIIKQYGTGFLDRYIHSLNLIIIKDEKGLNKFINERITQNPKSAAYYDNLIHELKSSHKRINKIDYSHRFYHVLTNMKREIKQYLNIDITLDCKNSHPLLFNYFIYMNKDISINNAYNISTCLSIEHYSTLGPSSLPITQLHNDRQNYYNLLRNNDLENWGFAKLEDDEIEYIYKTSNGLLWDELTEWALANPSVIDRWKTLLDDKNQTKYPELTELKGDDFKRAVRQVVKQEMFRQTFYARSSKILDDYDIGKEFAKRYPHVFKLISDWKKKKNAKRVADYMKQHNLPYTETSSLSVAMMGLESVIFTGILQRLYAKRWNAVHIHDCIVIPDDGNTNHPTKQQVQDIMHDVYSKSGLCPTFD